MNNNIIASVSFNELIVLTVFLYFMQYLLPYCDWIIDNISQFVKIIFNIIINLINLIFKFFIRFYFVMCLLGIIILWITLFDETIAKIKNNKIGICTDPNCVI